MTYKEFKIQYALGTLDLYELALYSKNKRILTILSKNPNVLIRCIVASNLSTPIKILGLLRKDENGWVRDHTCNNLKVKQL